MELRHDGANPVLITQFLIPVTSVTALLNVAHNCNVCLESVWKCAIKKTEG